MNNNHSAFAIRFHLILVVKYRRKVIDDGISERLKGIFRGIGGDCNIALEEWSHDTDRVRILFRSEPNPHVSKFVNAHKSASSGLIKKECPPIRPRLHEEASWSRPFCLVSAGGAGMGAIEECIEPQGG